ncbi:four-carbon acid sugar kinase family protein [Cohaesibacter celericrescens]|nr:four-carbon acid sugar kinase family protein [Cohaesibacter celericrescens]
MIADDLTGALDASVAFADRGLKVICAMSIASLPSALEQSADVVAISTGSRELSQQDAIVIIKQVRKIVEAAPSAQGAIWFKKIDSRLKGHIAAEVAVLRNPGQPVLVCPAFPRLGRYVRDGALCGVGVEQPIDVASVSGVDAAGCLDATSDADIDAGVGQFALDGLFVGAAGLAEGLARQLAPLSVTRASVVPPAPALFAIGSRDTVTLAQLQTFTPLAAPNGQVPSPQVWQGPLQIVQITPGADIVSGQEAGRAFASGIADWIKQSNPATLLACGGESASAIAKHLDIGLLEVRGEVLPGLPLSVCCDGGRDLCIVTKSGGFGSKDTLVNLSQKLVKIDESKQPEVRFCGR